MCKASSKRELSLTLSQAATTLCSEREREQPEASGVMKARGYHQTCAINCFTSNTYDTSSET